MIYIFFLSSCWLLVHPSLIHLLVSESVFSEAVPENQQMKHLLFSQQPMCFISSVSWSALNMVLISCLCSFAEASDSWACCVWATAGTRNTCVCCRRTKKRSALTCTSVQTDVGWWAAGPPLQAVCLRLSTVDYWWRWRPATFILLLCTDRHIYHVRVLQDPSQSICPQLKAIIFVSLCLYWLDKPVWCFRDAAVAEMNKVALACLLLFSLFSGIFCVPLQRWTQQVMIIGL